ncbi:aminotransferase class V-fold PLP-dependent enzyme [Pontibacillus marinus]|uniref:cysteine desulfurase n=1 Tax=Pontibacillus marinus BH030004 = DSM 16465 TaxID=1385511 RepID=A0A0A5G7W8_9BACI|nr:aminotransferase class V-fold PLP-dependent enzyme [Pontibacillus marinus]KGX89236.1 cysteine desulfurase [Pontibacillus marinus BH030004 = DSM 16465]
MIYFDQAASSFPKPPGVVEAVTQAITEYGANPGRGGHALSRKATEVIDETRKRLSVFFDSSDPQKVLFLPSATAGLNQAIKGFPFQEGDHVITTTFEHNAVRRPLEDVKKNKNLQITYINPLGEGIIEEVLGEVIQSNTKLLILNHASNLTGDILPIDTMIHVAKSKGIKVLLDASQTAGVIPISMKDDQIDMLAIPGHKGLLGPQGIGVLIVEGEIPLRPLIHGGTGKHSESIEQPTVWPEQYESGTLNTPGIAGLNASIKAIEEWGMEEIVSRETILLERCVKGLNDLEGVIVYGSKDLQSRVGVIAFNIDGVSSQEVTMILDQHYEICVRGGIHCTPLSHESMNTMENGGAVRVSFGPYNTMEEVDQFLRAIEEIKVGLQGGF